MVKLKEMHAFQAYVLRRDLDYATGQIFKIQSDAIAIMERRIALFEKYVLSARSNSKGTQITSEALDELKNEMAKIDLACPSYSFVARKDICDFKGMPQIDAVKQIEMQMHALGKCTERKLKKAKRLLRADNARGILLTSVYGTRAEKVIAFAAKVPESLTVRSFYLYPGVC